jgi:hypothetical protein
MSNQFFHSMTVVCKPPLDLPVTAGGRAQSQVGLPTIGQKNVLED